MSTVPPLQRVAFALFEGFTVLDVYGPVQAFASCRIVQSDGKRRPLFEIFSMASQAGRVKAGGGAGNPAHRQIYQAPDHEVVVIHDGLGAPAAADDTRALRGLSPPHPP